MEITLGVVPPARRAERSRLRGGWRWREWRALRRRRPRARERAGLSVDDVLRYRLLERLTGARHWPWAGADPGRALPASPPTPDYELLELESEAAAAETAAARDSARAAGTLAGAAVLALVVLALLAHVLRRCLRAPTKEEPTEERIVTSPSELPNTDPPPPYSELPTASEEKPGEEPPPPYSACYVAFSSPKDEPVRCHNERETLLNGENLVINLETSEDHRTSGDAIERSVVDCVEYSTRVCEAGHQVVT